MLGRLIDEWGEAKATGRTPPNLARVGIAFVFGHGLIIVWAIMLVTGVLHHEWTRHIPALGYGEAFLIFVIAVVVRLLVDPPELEPPDA